MADDRDLLRARLAAIGRDRMRAEAILSTSVDLVTDLFLPARAAGLTVVEIAQLSGIDLATVERWELPAPGLLFAQT